MITDEKLTYMPVNLYMLLLCQLFSETKCADGVHVIVESGESELDRRV